MLTKQEREEIAKRLNYCNDTDYYSFYRAVTGCNTTTGITLDEDVEELEKIILDLCDTSNMIELPLDKDGIPFKKGDTVYESDGTEHKVDGYTFTRNDTKILSVVDPINNGYVVLEADELTHKKPVTIASLAKELTDIAAADYGTPMVVKRKISDIANQLEKLGGSDD